jgi:RNA polymerase sigma-70 factor (ECF subfamily)
VSGESTAVSDPGHGLLDVYDRALPQVYGYLLSRCSQVALAEDLTAEVFLAAVDAVRREAPISVSVPWLIGVARHKLADHWRRQGRDKRRLAALSAEVASSTDPWEAHLNTVRAHDTLAKLEPQYRVALVLRYVDDLPVPEVAGILDRSVHSTEGLLVRARTAFRGVYTAEEAGDG